MRVVSTALFLFGIIAFAQLFRLQILRHTVYASKGSDQRLLARSLDPLRGEIYWQDHHDEKLYPLAINTRYVGLYAVPKNIEDVSRTTRSIAEITGVAETDLLQRFSRKNDPYEPIADKLTADQEARIRAADFAGIEFEEYKARYYPEHTSASHAVGFVGFVDDTRGGQYGIEEYFQEILQGENGLLHTEQDARGRPIGVGDRRLEASVNGATIVLTLDRTLEHVVCEKLQARVEALHAEGGSVVILDPKSGAILALCGYPWFDPNAYGETPSIRSFINPVISYTYEPGSIFKPLTMAAGIDLGVVSPQTIYEDTGSVQIGKFTIRNADRRAHGFVNMVGVLDFSLNLGAIFVVQKIGDENFEQYVKNFGFGELADIELTGEQPGDISALAKRRAIYSATASYGQGIAVTPIQMVTAFTALVNNGDLVKPFIVKKIIQHDEVLETKPKIIRRVVKPRTATTMRGMLASAVKNGYAKHARVPGYTIGGKTGTAQVPRTDGRGYKSDETIHSFIGFGPLDDAAFLMLVKIDKPKGIQFADATAAPLFREIAKFLFEYYEIPPDDPD